KNISKQSYPNKITVVVSDDGSSDNSFDLVSRFIKTKEFPANFEFNLVRSFPNQGKSNALNLALAKITTDLFCTVDGDSQLYKNALRNIVANMVCSGEATAAVAGTILVKNSRDSLLAKAQELDYAIGISSVKKTQSSLNGGTLVAQGAFSIYRTALVKDLKFQHSVGEDIVLTFGLRSKHNKIGHAENAFCFSNVPTTFKKYFRQRRRWARGLIEAFKAHPHNARYLKHNSPFIWYNLMFPFLDTSYMLFFLPGIIAAIFFQYYLLASLITLLLLPLMIISHSIHYYKQKQIFDAHGLKFRKNKAGLLFYAFLYQPILVLASISGYASEVFKLPKRW
ncbi:MAG: glycosyltransferase family 2 protein, partial [Saprospiraceae bacterium]